jgi:hypothetical protein
MFKHLSLGKRFAASNAYPCTTKRPENILIGAPAESLDSGSFFDRGEHARWSGEGEKGASFSGIPAWKSQSADWKRLAVILLPSLELRLSILLSASHSMRLPAGSYMEDRRSGVRCPVFSLFR